MGARSRGSVNTKRPRAPIRGRRQVTDNSHEEPLWKHLREKGLWTASHDSVVERASEDSAIEG